MRWLVRELFDYEREETTGEIVVFKVFELFLATYAIWWAWKWGVYIQEIEGVVLPLGIATWIDISFMFDHGASLVNAGLITAGSVLGFFRVAPRWTWLLATAGLHLHYAARFSLGEIGHSSHFVGLGMLGVTLAMWMSEDPRVRRRFALGFTIFFLGLGYTSAAVSKLVATGPAWADGRHLWLWIGEKTLDQYSKSGVLQYNALQALALSDRFVATAILGFGLLSELVGVLLWWRKLRPWVATVCIGLHVGIHVVMNIDFTQFIYQLVIIAYPWPRLIDAGLDRAGGGGALEPLRRFAHRFA